MRSRRTPPRRKGCSPPECRARARRWERFLSMDIGDRHRRHDRRRSLGGSLAGTNLERAGDYNQRVTLQAIRLNGPITRAELAQLTGLTTPAIANITNRLLSVRLIVEVGRLHGRRGQPAKRLAVNADGAFSIGV